MKYMAELIESQVLCKVLHGASILCRFNGDNWIGIQFL